MVWGGVGSRIGMEACGEREGEGTVGLWSCILSDQTAFKVVTDEDKPNDDSQR